MNLNIEPDTENSIIISNNHNRIFFQRVCIIGGMIISAIQLYGLFVNEVNKRGDKRHQPLLKYCYDCQNNPGLFHIEHQQSLFSMTNATRPTERNRDSPRGMNDKSDGYWQHLQCCDQKTFHLYAYSAYYDDREIVNGEPAAVRVFVGATQVERYKVNLTCLIDFQTNNGIHRYVQVDAALSVMGLGISKNKIIYRNYLISCNLSASHHHLGVPTSVYITCNSSISPVYPWIKLSVKLPDKATVKRNFAVCVCASYSYVNPHWLIEWVELHRILGVDKIFTYNKSLDDRSTQVLQHYVEEGFVDFKQTRPFFDLEGRDGAQLHKTPTINDCMYRNMHSFHKIIVIDFDEVIIPRHSLHYSDLFIQLNKNYTKMQQFVFLNAFFYLEFPQNNSESNLDLISLTHPARQPKQGLRSVKTIINPLMCIKMHNHVCWLCTSDIEKESIIVDTSVGIKHHYKKCAFREEREPVCKDIIKSDYVHDSSIYRFKDQLISNVEAREADIYVS